MNIVLVQKLWTTGLWKILGSEKLIPRRTLNNKLIWRKSKWPIEKEFTGVGAMNFLFRAHQKSSDDRVSAPSTATTSLIIFSGWDH